MYYFLLLENRDNANVGCFSNQTDIRLVEQSMEQGNGVTVTANKSCWEAGGWRGRAEWSKGRLLTGTLGCCLCALTLTSGAYGSCTSVHVQK